MACKAQVEELMNRHCPKLKMAEKWVIGCGIYFLNQEFLFWFKRIGWNYIVASVIICVIVPLIIYGLLVWGIYKSLMT